MRPGRLCVSALVALAACDDPIRPGVLLGFRLSAVEQWSGGEVDERRLYVGGLGADSTVQLQVYDLANFRLIGTLTTGEKCPTKSWICQGGALGVDPNFNRLHLVSPGLPAHEWTFDRLP